MKYYFAHFKYRCSVRLYAGLCEKKVPQNQRDLWTWYQVGGTDWVVLEDVLL